MYLQLSTQYPSKLPNLLMLNMSKFPWIVGRFTPENPGQIFETELPRRKRRRSVPRGTENDAMAPWTRQIFHRKLFNI